MNEELKTLWSQLAGWSGCLNDMCKRHLNGEPVADPNINPFGYGTTLILSPSSPPESLPIIISSKHKDDLPIIYRSRLTV